MNDLVTDIAQCLERHGVDQPFFWAGFMLRKMEIEREAQSETVENDRD